ncbi:hypothetical protein BCU94_07350 [Shewanella sp. 10N.286.52.C2]|uniref:hypothetical protein n=1 Tax=Shewanella sp. 10N.286.52.C2 TaxID=1880838 RepID=UPI000C85CC46|nr:hypothetical protein [Shewanella sp. 10N.286.52.C2]PMG31545.1 hypothetical protein BCU94_07350 [Shewanella sp. 10N.286.52.C2]
MKNIFICTILIFSSFSVCADVFTQWEKVIGMYITRGTALNGSNEFARASLHHDNLGEKSFIYIAFALDKAQDLTECKNDWNKNVLRSEKITVDGKMMEFYVSCGWLMKDKNYPALNILYYTIGEENNNFLKERFFKSNYVVFNGYKFSAKGFTKMVRQYHLDKQLTL